MSFEELCSIFQSVTISMVASGIPRATPKHWLEKRVKFCFSFEENMELDEETAQIVQNRTGTEVGAEARNDASPARRQLPTVSPGSPGGLKWSVNKWSYSTEAIRTIRTDENDRDRARDIAFDSTVVDDKKFDGRVTVPMFILHVPPSAAGRGAVLAQY